jgi:hypothetical protein
MKKKTPKLHVIKGNKKQESESNITTLDIFVIICIILLVSLLLKAALL